MKEDNSVIVEPEASKKEPSAKKPRNKKLGIIAAVLVVILAAAGGGFYVWHQTPSFCDAICHNPQDPYTPTFEAEPGQPAVDKWGNEVADARGMLAPFHRKFFDANCLSCHEPTMQEQISEGMEWVTGNFYNPLSERDLNDLCRWNGKDEIEFCAKSGCHATISTKEDLTEVTANLERNPHSWHHVEYDCSDCHKAHRASIMVCADCHEDAEVPAGWITPAEERELGTTYLSYKQEQELYAE